MRRWLNLVAAVALFGMAGCASMLPTWGSPGSHEQQQSNAALHDPYPDDSLGPPIMGGRPPGFQKPRAEAVREQPFVNPQVPLFR